MEAHRASIGSKKRRVQSQGSGTVDSDATKKAEMELKIRKRVALEEKAFRIVERLLANPITEDFLIDTAKFIDPNHYKDVVEERSIVNQCGYPVCENRLKNVPKQKYHICTKSQRVYDITDRKKFCSGQCYQASEYYKKQLSSTPVWLREGENLKPCHLLAPLHARELEGEVVLVHPSLPVKMEVDQAEEVWLPRSCQPDEINSDLTDSTAKLHNSSSDDTSRQASDTKQNAKTRGVVGDHRSNKQSSFSQEEAKRSLTIDTDQANRSLTIDTDQANRSLTIDTEQADRSLTIDTGQANRTLTTDTGQVNGMFKFSIEQANRPPTITFPQVITEEHPGNHDGKRELLHSNPPSNRPRPITEQNASNLDTVILQDHASKLSSFTQESPDLPIIESKFPYTYKQEEMTSTESRELSNLNEGERKESVIGTSRVKSTNEKITEILEKRLKERKELLRRAEMQFSKGDETSQTNLYQSNKSSCDTSDNVWKLPSVDLGQDTQSKKEPEVTTLTAVEPTVTVNKLPSKDTVLSENTETANFSQGQKAVDEATNTVENKTKVLLQLLERRESLMAKLEAVKGHSKGSESSRKSGPPTRSTKQVTFCECDLDLKAAKGDIDDNNSICSKSSNSCLCQNAGKVDKTPTSALNVRSSCSNDNYSDVIHRVDVLDLNESHSDTEVETSCVPCLPIMSSARSPELRSQHAHALCDTDLETSCRSRKPVRPGPLPEAANEKVPKMMTSCKSVVPFKQKSTDCTNNSKDNDKQPNIRTPFTTIKDKPPLNDVKAKTKNKNTMRDVKKKPRKTCKSVLVMLRMALQEWKTPATARYLTGGKKPRDDGMTEEEYAQQRVALCKKLDAVERDFSYLVDQEAVDDVTGAACEVPDIVRLREDSQRFSRKVQEFYGGRPDVAQARKFGDKNQENTAEHDGRAPTVPYIDSQSQLALRRKIVLDKLKRILPDLLGPLKLTMRDISGELRQLVGTFRLTSDNIMYKPAEWTLLGFIILKLLALRVDLVRQAFQLDYNIHYFRSLTLSVGITDGQVTQLVNDVTSSKDDQSVTLQSGHNDLHQIQVAESSHEPTQLETMKPWSDATELD